MSRLRGSPACLDCGLVHGRAPQASLCLPCRRARRLVRNRTPKYHAYQDHWNRSPRAKIIKARWERRHPEARLASLARSRARRRGPHLVPCQVFGCENAILRVRSSHAFMCLDCAADNYGASYVRTRAEWKLRAA